jgi:hypothetical protein
VSTEYKILVGKTEWERSVGKRNGRDQLENGMGEISWKTEWERSVGKPGLG